MVWWIRDSRNRPSDHGQSGLIAVHDRSSVCDDADDDDGLSNSVSDVRAISTNRMQFSVRNEPGCSRRVDDP